MAASRGVSCCYWLMVAVVTASLVMEAAAQAATSHVVGGSSTGWRIPSNATFYSDWASTQTFAAGDTLVFNFQTGTHDVVEVPRSSYDACSTANQIGSTINAGPATVTITSGNHYYICGFTGHCSAGQKLAITVAATTTTTPPPSPATTTTPPPSPATTTTTTTPPPSPATAGGPSSGGGSNAASPLLPSRFTAAAVAFTLAAALLSATFF